MPMSVCVCIQYKGVAWRVKEHRKICLPFKFDFDPIYPTNCCNWRAFAMLVSRCRVRCPSARWHSHLKVLAEVLKLILFACVFDLSLFAYLLVMFDFQITFYRSRFMQAFFKYLAKCNAYTFYEGIRRRHI